MTTPTAAIERTLRGDVSWLTEPGWVAVSIADAAAEHGVDALLWDRLPATSAPAAGIRQLLDARVRAAVTRALIVRREMRLLLDALASAGVNALVVKGAALASTIYEKPWHRPHVDVDLIVAEGQVTSAEDSLASCGYARSAAISTGTVVSHQIAFERTDTHGVHHVIDLHWKIVNPHVVADALTFEDLWTRRRPAPAVGASAAVPSSVDSVVLAAIHRLAHHQGHDRLIWLYDLRLLTATLSTQDWTSLVSLATSRSVAGLCLDALQQAHARVGAEPPERVMADLARAAPNEPSHRYLEGPVARIDVLESDLRTLPSWGARWKLLKEHAFPPAAFIRQRYGVKNPLLLPALYLHRLVVGAAKWVR